MKTYLTVLLLLKLGLNSKSQLLEKSYVVAQLHQ